MKSTACCWGYHLSLFFGFEGKPQGNQRLKGNNWRSKPPRNVAVTRAKHRAWIVGDMETLYAAQSKGPAHRGQGVWSGRQEGPAMGARLLSYISLPEFMDFILFGKTILVVNKKFGLFLANQHRKRDIDGAPNSTTQEVTFALSQLRTSRHVTRSSNKPKKVFSRGNQLGHIGS